MSYPRGHQKSHSAWSESSAAHLRVRGGHQTGEQLGAGAIATIERRVPKDRAVSAWFRGNGPKEAKGEGQKAEPIFRVLGRKG